MYTLGRLIALAVFAACGWWVFTVLSRSDLVTQAGGYVAVLWRPLAWAALIALVVALVWWRRQWERFLLMMLAFAVIGLVVHINNRDAFTGVLAVVVPASWWIFWFTFAEAALVLLSLAYVFKFNLRRLKWWSRKSQKGGEVSAA